MELTQIDSWICLQQDGFIRKGQKIPRLDMWSKGELFTVQRNKGGDHSFRDLGGAVIDKELVGESESLKYSDS